MKELLSHQIKIVKILTCLVGFSFMNSTALAQKTLLERNLMMTSKEKNIVEARASMVNEAYVQVTQELVKEIIGETKYNKSKSLIATKVLKNTARFIPFSKTGEIKPLDPEGYSMTINLKVSVSDLQSILLENGLFYQSDSTPMIIPTVRFTDKVNGRTYSWWYSKEKVDRSYLMKQGRVFENYLKGALGKNSFYLIRTQQFRYADSGWEFPRSESVRLENWQAISQKVGAQIQIHGDIVFSPSQERSESFNISIHLTAIQILNGRIIAEITRQFETDSGPFQIVIDKKVPEIFENASSDLAAQILDAWQKGAFGAELFKIVVKGRLPMVTQESLKEFIKSKAREVKSVRERLISADGLVFEVDASLSPQDLATRLPQIDLGNEDRLMLESVVDKEVIYRFVRK